jgi:hypothetical protein
MTIRRYGGVFGRNPTFHSVEIEDSLVVAGTLSVGGSTLNALNFKGTWNALTNTPTLASGVGTTGDLYIVATAGTTTLDGVSNWGIGDWVLFSGSTWQRVEGGANGNFVELTSSSTTILNGTTIPVSNTLLVSTDIGSTVQGYDANTAKYDDATANFTGTLQNGGSNVLVDTDIGSTVQGYDADTAKYDDTTANFTGTLQQGGNNVFTAADTIGIANGGTGETTAQTAINALAGATTSGQYLRGNGTNVLMSAIQAADVPTLNQNTTGTASNVTGTVAVANGGTGQTTQQLALNAIAGAVTSGQYLRGNGSNVAMSAIQAGDVPTLNQSTTGSAGSVKSNSTTGLLEVTGPAAGATRVMTTPNANFTAARTDAAQTFTGAQTFGTINLTSLFGVGVVHATIGDGVTFTVTAWPDTGGTTYLFIIGSNNIANSYGIAIGNRIESSGTVSLQSIAAVGGSWSLSGADIRWTQSSGSNVYMTSQHFRVR